MKKCFIFNICCAVLLLCFNVFSANSQYLPVPKTINDPLDQNKVVGTLPGSFAINNKGAATYYLPFTVPPGTAGMTPSLSISYNSQHKNGILGIGWSLNGISEITRIPSTYYFDGKTKSVDLTTSDVYSLDSMRLILISGTHGTDGAVYGTEIESFTRVIAHGSAGNSGPAWFEAITKDGTVIEYGNSQFSRVEATGTSVVLRWRVNKVTDANGNYMTFLYEELAGAESLLSSISYTGNDANGLSPYNTISFYYSFRNANNDPFFKYVGGAKISNTALLNTIEMRTNNGNTFVRRYTFNYFFDFYSHLNEVFETGSDGSQMNSTIFQWGSASSNYTALSISAGNNLKFYQGDFNGDGKIDLISHAKKTTFTDTDLWTIKLNETASPTQFTGTLGSTFKEFVVADVNCDGKDELFRRRRQTSPSIAEKFEMYYFNGTTLVRGSDQYDLYFYNADALMTLHPADFDGDGELDYMGLKSDKNLEGFKGINQVGPSPAFNTPNFVKIIDFNGDKKADILVIKSSNSFIYSFNSISGYWETIYSSTTFPLSTDRIYTGDYNGDLKTDILYYRSGWNLKYSTGNSFATATYAPSLRNYDPGASITDNNYYIGDFNGDGMDDIIEMYKTGTSTKNVDVFYSKGECPFVKDVNLYSPLSLDEPFYLVVDYDCDGQKDLWRYDYLNSSGANEIRISYFHRKEKRDLISGIRNGMGNKSQITYENLNYRNYDYTSGWKYLLSRGTTEVFPNQDYTGPIIVVYQSSSTNALGYLDPTNYSYEGAKKHRQGKGFIGILKLTTKSDEQHKKSESEYNFNSTYSLLTPKTERSITYYDAPIGIEVVSQSESVLSTTVNIPNNPTS